MITKQQQTAGFTLIEVLLAMAITAFIAMLSYSALSASIASSEVHGRKAQQLADVQLALSFLERDIRHAVGRGIRDEYGDQQPALSGGALEDFVLQLTRRGWDNPSGARRGELQRVRYQLEGESLWRESWLVLDRISEDDGLQRALLIDNVTDLSLRFLRMPTTAGSASSLVDGWSESWAVSDDSLPLAIEVDITIKHFGQVTRIFSLAAP